MAEKCFVITPIGASDSPERKRADRLCDQIVLPAIEGSKPTLVVERGDRIQSSGPITVQLVEAITSAKLIVADLVDPNPNVYYELGIAESFGMPIIRFGGKAAEALPFDVRDMRTISLPKGEDGRIDVVDANRCIKTIREMLPEMLDPAYKPKSVVALAERQAKFDSLAEAIPSGGDGQELLLHELAARVQEMTRELESVRSDIGKQTADPFQPVRWTARTGAKPDLLGFLGPEKYLGLWKVLSLAGDAVSMKDLTVVNIDGEALLSIGNSVHMLPPKTREEFISQLTELVSPTRVVFSD